MVLRVESPDQQHYRNQRWYEKYNILAQTWATETENPGLSPVTCILTSLSNNSDAFQRLKNISNFS